MHGAGNKSSRLSRYFFYLVFMASAVDLFSKTPELQNPRTPKPQDSNVIPIQQRHLDFYSVHRSQRYILWNLQYHTSATFPNSINSLSALFAKIA